LLSPKSLAAEPGSVEGQMNDDRHGAHKGSLHRHGQVDEGLAWITGG
jgi:hypothetical protein